MRLFLLLVIIPFIELKVLLDVHDLVARSQGSDMATFVTFGSIIATGFLGAKLARQQGFATLRNIQNQMRQGVMPTTALIDGVLILVGAILLLTPGYLTDAAGLLMLFPLTRQFFRKKTSAWLTRQSQTGKVFVSYGGFTPPREEPQRPYQNVIDVEVKDHRS